MATGFVLSNPRFRAFQSGTNLPIINAQIYFYVAGSNNIATVFSDALCTVPLPSPVLCDTNGAPVTASGSPTCIYANQAVDIQIFDSNNVLIDSSMKNISFEPLITSSGGSVEWNAIAGIPVYVSGTSFQIVGNLTAQFTIGRRFQATVTSGTITGTIISSTYGAGNTVVVIEGDNGSLDNGLSSVSIGILNSLNTSLPILAIPTTNTGTSSAYSFSGQDIPQLPGSAFTALIGITNTGTSTISINGSAPAIMYKWGTVPLEAGDLVSGTYAVFFRGATTWQLMNPGIIDDARFETNSINANKLVNSSITDAQIATTTITGDRLVNSTVTSTQTDNTVAPAMNTSGTVVGRTHNVTGTGVMSSISDPFGGTRYCFIINLSGAAAFTSQDTYGVQCNYRNIGIGFTPAVNTMLQTEHISGSQFVVYGNSNQNGQTFVWSATGY